MASAQQVRVRIASAMAATARLNRICQCNTIRSASKVKFYKSLVTYIPLCGCETWTLLADSEERIQAFETQSLRTLFRIFFSEHKTKKLGAEQDRNLFWQLSRDGNLHGSDMSHATTASPKTILQGTLYVGWATPWSVEEMLDG